jgi:hypothetical protein
LSWVHRANIKLHYVVIKRDYKLISVPEATSVPSTAHIDKNFMSVSRCTNAARAAEIVDELPALPDAIAA